MDEVKVILGCVLIVIALIGFAINKSIAQDVRVLRSGLNSLQQDCTKLEERIADLKERMLNWEGKAEIVQRCLQERMLNWEGKAEIVQRCLQELDRSTNSLLNGSKEHRERIDHIYTTFSKGFNYERPTC